MFTFCSDDYGHGTSGRLFCCKRFVSCFPSRKCHYSSVNSSKKNMKRKLKLARLGRPTSRIMSALTTLNDQMALTKSAGTEFKEPPKAVEIKVNISRCNSLQKFIGKKEIQMKSLEKYTHAGNGAINTDVEQVKIRCWCDW